MPRGRAIKYERFDYEALKTPLRLDPPDGAARAYLHSEVGYVRYLFTEDLRGEPLKVDNGFPLLPDYPAEFDTDLGKLWVVAGMKDSIVSVYWFGT